jgi:uncharacterized RDD family membrane protein YckC
MKTIEFISAQNVKIEYELANTGQRVAAALIDGIALLVLSIILNYTQLAFFSRADAGTLSVVNLVIRLPWVIYFPLVEYFTNGQSLGKYVLGIRVVSLDGDTPGFKEIFARWAFRGDFVLISLDGTAFLWLGFGILGAFYSFISEKNQRLSDVMAKTVVIKKNASKFYTLKNVLSIKNQENYEPTYPQVIQFTDEDMMLIKLSLNRLQKYKNDEVRDFVKELAHKSAELLNLPETPPKKVQFLKTLLQDYVVLTR